MIICVMCICIKYIQVAVDMNALQLYIDTYLYASTHGLEMFFFSNK